MASVGVSAPGMEILSSRFGQGDDLGMNAGTDDELGAGVDGGLACSAVVTVPEPSRSFRPYSVLSSLSTSTAPGTVMVTSTTVTPPAIML